jgi:hypothetical protein
MQIIYTRPDGGTSVITLADKSTVPEAVGMTDQQFAEWVRDRSVPGDATDVSIVSAYTPPEVIPETPAPSTITMRQARQALYQAGLLDQANAFIAAIPGSDGDKARIAWEYAGDVERANPLVAQIAASLGLSDQQVDDLFTLGASL